MKIIDNRYKIENFMFSDRGTDTYLVTDTMENAKQCVLKFYNYDDDDYYLKYLQEEFINLTSLKQKNIGHNIYFEVMKFVDSKRTNHQLYYSISEYITGKQLYKVISQMSLKERVRVLLDITVALDYLHFRGYSYRMLLPENIFIYKDGSVKLLDIASVYEQYYKSDFARQDETRKFSSGDLSFNSFFTDKRNDNLGLLKIVEYMFFDQALLEQDKLTKEQTTYLNSLIDYLNDKAEGEIKGYRGFLADLQDVFNLEYYHNLKEEREFFNFNAKIAGRKEEIKKIMEIDSGIINGTNGYKGLLLSAEHGMGKSRLLEEIIHKLLIKKRNVYFLDMSKTRPDNLSGLTDVLKQTLQDSPMEMLDMNKKEVSNIIEDIKEFLSKENQLKTDIDLEYVKIFSKVVRYFEKFSKGTPTYFVLDDIHLSKDKSLALLEYVFRYGRTKNTFFIFTFDKDYFDSKSQISLFMEKYISSNVIKNIELQKLTLEEIGEIIQGILGINYTPEKFAGVLYKESNGNPKYIEHILNHLYLAGDIYIADSGYWRIKSNDYYFIDFPATLDEAFLKQYSVIKEDYTNIFNLLSFSENALSLDQIKDILPKEKDLEKKLKELLDLGYIEDYSFETRVGYNIKNNQLKRYIYNGLNEEVRSNLHAKIAKTLQKKQEKDKIEHLEEIIFHLLRSNQIEKALKVILGYLKETENPYSQKTQTLWEMAYGLEEKDIDNKLNILENLLKIYSIKEDSEKLCNVLKEYELVARSTNNFKHIVNAKQYTWDLDFKDLKMDETQAGIEEIEKISKDNNYAGGLVIGLILKAKLAIAFGKAEEGLVHLEEAIDICIDQKTIKNLNIIYNLKGVASYFTGDHEYAVKCYQESIKYSELENDIQNITKPLNNLGNVYAADYGDFEKADYYYQKGLDIANKWGFVEIKSRFLTNLAEDYKYMGDYEKALDHYEEVKNISYYQRDYNLNLQLHANIGETYLLMKDLMKAREMYEYIKDIFGKREINLVEVLYQCNSFLGLFEGYIGNLEHALIHMEKAYEAAKDFNQKVALLEASRILVLKFFKDGKMDKKEMDKIRKEFAQISLVKDRKEMLIYFAYVALLSNDLAYMKEILAEEETLETSYLNRGKTNLRDSLLAFAQEGPKETMQMLINISNSLTYKENYERIIINKGIADLAFMLGQYDKVLKYSFITLDLLFKFAKSLEKKKYIQPFLKIMELDRVKANVKYAIKHQYGNDLEIRSLDQMNLDTLEDFCDTFAIIEAVGKKNFFLITGLDEVCELDEGDLPEILLRLSQDPDSNLKILLNYVSKISLAERTLVFDYDAGQNIYASILSNKKDESIDIDLSYFGNRQLEEGLLIRINGHKEMNHHGLLNKDKIAVIVWPLMNKNTSDSSEHIKDKQDGKDIGSYIYLETKSIFHEFNLETLEKIKKVLPLIYMNREIKKHKVLAYTDKLTNSYTRKYYEKAFDEMFIYAKNNNKNLSMLMIDIDKFKIVNDTHGHRKGDQVLAAISKSIKDNLRSQDILGRYGGEEFIVLLEDANKNQAKKISERIRKDIEALSFVSIKNKITVSIGISSFPEHGQFKEELMEKADQALYHAKDLGRNRVEVYKMSMHGRYKTHVKTTEVLTGNAEEDNRFTLGLLDVISLLEEDSSKEEKISVFLRVLSDTLQSDNSFMILFSDKKEEVYASNKNLAIHKGKNGYNKTLVANLKKTKKGQLLVDWNPYDSKDHVSQLPNWESVILLPLNRDKEIIGALYLSASLSNKEFTARDYNLANKFISAFMANL